ncbi:MAG: aminoacyl-tRNA hydrolase [Flavobacteriales bacterium]|nr:aminoacyl-tRNA hydrolase [Flavobacteriales bacterium]|tara:strand:+ start:559 stop:1122 length:564 start_codon:yes stop_codon:yes gene_type:complete
MKYLIVGLGNIGSEYKETRHNIGFKILDAFVDASNSSFKPERLGDVAQIKHRGRNLICLKPSTYMNLSGKAIRYWMQHEKIPQERLLVLTDELSLPFGKIRLRSKGSDGGHNGLKNIQELLGTKNYARLRFGIAAEFTKGKQVDYVLGEWNSEEKKILEERIKIVSDLIKSFTTNPIERVMSDFNGR